MLKKQLSIIALAISTNILVQAFGEDIPGTSQYESKARPVGLLHEETEEGEYHLAPVGRALGIINPERYSEGYSEPKHYRGYKKHIKEKEYTPDNDENYSEYED